ncbi:hypothetical protein AMTRI_Chr13g92620 [Amborella trichopoda]
MVNQISVGNAVKWHALISSIVKVGLFENLKKINDNAYKLKLPSHIHTSDVFNVKHLIPCRSDTFDDEHSRENSFDEGGLMQPRILLSSI